MATVGLRFSGGRRVMGGVGKGFFVLKPNIGCGFETTQTVGGGRACACILTRFCDMRPPQLLDEFRCSFPVFFGSIFSIFFGLLSESFCVLHWKFPRVAATNIAEKNRKIPDPR
jgi:hypothetical protein